jgi:hypothetical protein
MRESMLLWGLLFSSIGVGFFIYGKRQRSAAPMICGIALCIYPYVVSNAAVMVVIGVALCAVPYFFRR